MPLDAFSVKKQPLSQRMDKLMHVTPTSHRYLTSNPAARPIATALYEAIVPLPLVYPHGHVDPRLFADSHAQFVSPVDALIQQLHSLLEPVDLLIDGGNDEPNRLNRMV